MLRPLAPRRFLTAATWLGTALASLSAIAAERAPRFEQDILPLFQARCVKCHGPLNPAGQLSLCSAPQVSLGGASGSAITSGSVDESLLWQRVAAEEMPPDNPLPPAERALLRAWVAAGAPGLPDAKSIGAAESEHWAFRRLGKPSVPPVEDLARVRTSVDRFLQQSLEQRGLGLGPDADRSTLVRRLSFDLTGLPPTPEEISAFLCDAGDDAYERLVDHYLASPRYGEHWGQHWLDIAGYADSNGYFDVDTDRPLAYRYRDYVVRSVNRDKPFDRFLREQLAGDELAGFTPGETATPETVELLEATHFLRNGQDGTGDSDGNAEVLMNDRRAAREAVIENWGSALFGLTLKCAKCHDHKFEPITQQDYFQLCAIIAPVFDFDNWVKPNERIVRAPLADELAKFNAALKAGTTGEFGRPGKIAWTTDVSLNPAKVYIPMRGDYALRGPEVEPGGLAFLTDPDNAYTFRTPKSGSNSTGRRLAFAEWLTRPDSRPAALVARNHVNRVWQRYFGAGLAATTDNLGVSGATPSHSELLEWLTAEFVRSGWSQKALHRLIATSTVYRQSSELQQAALEADQDGRLLWRMPTRRLTAEQFRDALLEASGVLDHRMGGEPTHIMRSGVGEVLVYFNVPGGRRRSVYLEHRRSDVPTLLKVFDAPSIVSNCVERQASSTPLQSLQVLNAEFTRDCASRMAQRLLVESGLENDERVAHAFLVALGRAPDAEEVRLSLSFVRTQTKHYAGSETPQRRAWTDLCQSLLASSEFLYLD